jgi:hypothetical protein
MRHPTLPCFLALLAVAGCAGSEDHYARSSPGDAPASERVAAAKVAPAPVADALNAPPPDPAVAPAVDRVVIYTGHIQLVVSDIARTLDAIQAYATSNGGYLQETDGKSITIRIPAKRFNDTFNWVARQGEVVQRQVKSQDVTEELRDLKLRLENAEHTRTRLLDILSKSTKTEDTLKIEAELQRITETIELLKGKLVALNSQVAFSTLTVALNSPLPQNQLVAQIPFDWVRRLGEGVLSGSASPYARSSRRDRREIRIDVPKSYIRYYDADETSELMSADGVVVRIHKHDNYKGGDLDFWSGRCSPAACWWRTAPSPSTAPTRSP